MKDWKDEIFENSVFQNYQTYSDYKNIEFTPEKMQSDAVLFVKKLMPTFCDSWINQVEEQSDDLKGIKFEFKVKSETINVIKLGGFLGDWDLFFNKKRIKKSDLKNYLEKKSKNTIKQIQNNIKFFNCFSKKSKNIQKQFKLFSIFSKQINFF